MPIRTSEPILALGSCICIDSGVGALMSLFSVGFQIVFDVLTSLVCRSTSGCLESFFRSIQCK